MITIPVIKNFIPSTLVEDISGVQPMTSPLVGMKFTWKHVVGDRIAKEGDFRHSFLEGWQCFYGGVWISMNLWWKIKICGY